MPRLGVQVALRRGELRVSHPTFQRRGIQLAHDEGAEAMAQVMEAQRAQPGGLLSAAQPAPAATARAPLRTALARTTDGVQAIDGTSRRRSYEALSSVCRGREGSRAALSPLRLPVCPRIRDRNAFRAPALSPVGVGVWAAGVAVVAALALPAVVERVNRAEDRLARLSTSLSVATTTEEEHELRRQIDADSGDELWLGVGEAWRDLREAVRGEYVSRVCGGGSRRADGLPVLRLPARRVGPDGR